MFEIERNPRYKPPAFSQEWLEAYCKAINLKEERMGEGGGFGR